MVFSSDKEVIPVDMPVRISIQYELIQIKKCLCVPIFLVVQKTYVVLFSTVAFACVRELRNGLYTGTVSVTNHGRTCQNWLTLADYLELTDEDFAVDGKVADAKNFSRNFIRPGGYTRPLCFTTDPKFRLDGCSFSICYGERDNVKSNHSAISSFRFTVENNSEGGLLL